MKSNTCFKKNGEPLSVYSTWEEAERAAKYVKTNFGLEVVPYGCKKCKKYHHSPKDRHTPSRTCDYCTDSHGEYKELYESYEAAERRRRIIYEEKGIWLNIYECKYYLGGYHFTKGVKYG